MDDIYRLMPGEKYFPIIGFAKYCERYNLWRYSVEGSDFNGTVDSETNKIRNSFRIRMMGLGLSHVGLLGLIAEAINIIKD